MSGTSRLLAWSALWLALAGLTYALALPNLPAEVAVHWDGTGLADGSAPSWAIPAIAAGVMAIGLVLSVQFRIGSEPSMEAFAVIGMLGGLGFAVTLITVVANWGVSEWTEASSLSLWAIAGIFVISILGLLAGIVIGRALYPIKELQSPDEGDLPATEVAAGERVSWVGRARVRWMTMALFAVAIVLLFVFPEIPVWVFLGVAGIGVVFSQVEANVTNDGLRVRLGGLPVRKIALGEVSSARSIDLEPTEWGGWGWRVAPGRSAIVLRRGEALEVTFKNGRRFAITVDDSLAGAALLNGLVDLGMADG